MKIDVKWSYKRTKVSEEDDMIGNNSNCSKLR